MAYFLPQTRSRSMKNVAVLNSPVAAAKGGSLVKCQRFPTVCSRKYTQLTRLTLSLPLTIPKLTPDDIASLTWVCKNFEVSLHSTPVPVTHPVCHNLNFNISQFFILNAENSSFPISSKYDFTIRAIPLCATKRYVLSGCALISSSRLYIRCAR